jgi:hypothetical protein
MTYLSHLQPSCFVLGSPSAFSQSPPVVLARLCAAVLLLHRDVLDDQHEMVLVL